MKDHLVDHDDLQRQMRKEAREDQRAEHWTTFSEGLQDMSQEDIEDLKFAKLDLREEIDSEITDLQRQLRELEQKRDRVSKEIDKINSELKRRDPEAVLEVIIGEDPRTGPRVGYSMEKRPPETSMKDCHTDGVSDLMNEMEERMDLDLWVDLQSPVCHVTLVDQEIQSVDWNIWVGL